MLPAQQRLDTDDAVGLEAHLRLVIDRQLVVLDSKTEFAHQRQPPRVVLIDAGAINDETRRRAFGRPHSHVGAAQ